MKDNRGFSLIEMIVVIAMVAILTSVGLTVFGLSDNGYVKENAQSLTSMLEKAAYNTQAVAAKAWIVKVEAHGEENPDYVASLWKVDEDDAGNLITTVVEEYELTGKVKLKLDTQLESAAAISELEIVKDEPLEIMFMKQTGEIGSLTAGGETYNRTALAGNKGTITVISGDKEKTIEIYWSTGKIFTN